MTPEERLLAARDIIIDKNAAIAIYKAALVDAQARIDELTVEQ